VRRLRWCIGIFTVLLAPGVGAGSEVPRACELGANSVQIQVQGVRSSKGAVVAVLYGDKPDEFLKKGARVARERVPAHLGSVTLCLEVPWPGVYALVVFHDENENRKFDRAWNGLPSEGFGVSNNAQAFLRPPTHREAAFNVAGHTVLKIELRY
jgi:uncharacterized protein (DUF2141 family)